MVNTIKGLSIVNETCIGFSFFGGFFLSIIQHASPIMSLVS